MNQLKDKTNNIVGGIVFTLSLILYFLTMAPTVSFWDCGEFIACSYTLGVPHPPGAPFFLLLGRFFSFLPDFLGDVAFRINLISVISSAFCVLLAYLITVRLIEFWRGKPKTFEDKIITFGSSAIGALTLATTDSFWFNAVEAEVYAISMFFTAVVFWLILVWEEQARNDEENEAILLLIVYLIGLSSGVHLLNILTVPTIALIIYFQKDKSKNIDYTKIFGVFAASFIVLGFINFLFVTGIPLLYDVTDGPLLILVILTLSAFLGYKFQKENKITLSIAFYSIFLLILGFTSYEMILIRSGLNTIIDENNPENAKNFISYLKREQYGTENQFLTVFERNAPFWSYQIEKMYVRYFAWQFVGKTSPDFGEVLKGYRTGEPGYGMTFLGIPLAVGLIGAYHHFVKDWKRALANLVFFFLMGIAIVLYVNQPDPQPRDRDYSYVGSFFAFALWIGIGLSAILEELTQKLKNTNKTLIFTGILAISFFALPVWMAYKNFPEHNRKGNYVAWDYSYNILQSCEPNAILFTNGDNDTFPLWYLQEVEGIRKDIKIVNLSLLNTDWYIKQLRDNEPKIHIPFKDAVLEEFRPMLWETQEVKIPLSQTALDEFKLSQGTTMDVLVKPTFQGRGIRVQDLMIIQLIKFNIDKRPIYFAVTIPESNQVGLADFMRMDGLAFKILPYKVSKNPDPDKNLPLGIVPEILEQKITQEFKYRQINDPSVFFDDNVKGLLQNYRSAFLRLVYNYRQKNDNSKVLALLKQMDEILPETVVPIRHKGIATQIGLFYHEAGDSKTLETKLDNLFSQKISDTEREDVGQTLLSTDVKYPPELAEKIEKFLVSGFDSDPSKRALVSTYLISFYELQENYEKGIELLERWVSESPNDRRAKAKLDLFKKMLAGDGSLTTQDSTAQLQVNETIDKTKR
ncbi:DUF2723 domain-containing protein [bacterium]|nr:DUF2723 domain-containing protein [bacterium]